MVQVLIVEDNDLVSFAIGDLLTENGYSISMAANGQAALEAMGTLSPALVITDLQMPIMDGRALALNMRADVRLKHIPVLFLTSHFLDPVELAKIGSATLVLKPWKADILLQIISGLLEKTRSVVSA